MDNNLRDSKWLVANWLSNEGIELTFSLIKEGHEGLSVGEVRCMDNDKVEEFCIGVASDDELIGYHGLGQGEVKNYYKCNNNRSLSDFILDMFQCFFEYGLIKNCTFGLNRDLIPAFKVFVEEEGYNADMVFPKQ